MSTPGYDPAAAYRYGLLVQAAYRLLEESPPGTQLSPPAGFPADFRIVLYLYAVDHVLAERTRQPFGFVARSTSDPKLVVVAIRGTEKLIEWLIDAEFMPKPFSAVPNAGMVEEGFHSVFRSLTGQTPEGGAVGDIRTFIQQQAKNGTLVITGHSLGGAVANLLALDIAVNAPVDDLVVYTLAAPRTGDRTFCDMFNRRVPNAFRVFNEHDIVPRTPPGYEQVDRGEPIDSRNDPRIGHSVTAYHVIATYLTLLDDARNATR